MLIKEAVEKIVTQNNRNDTYKFGEYTVKLIYGENQLTLEDRIKLYIEKLAEVSV